MSTSGTEVDRGKISRVRFVKLLGASAGLVALPQAGAQASEASRRPHETRTSSTANARVFDVLTRRYGLGFDTKDWELLRSSLATRFRADFSDYTGNPPRRISADAFVAFVSELLSEVNTQHNITNPTIDVRGRQATCVANMFARHRLRSAPDGPSDESLRFDMVGRYVFDLSRTGEQWRITGLTQIVAWTEGDSSILVPPAGPSPI